MMRQGTSRNTVAARCAVSSGRGTLSFPRLAFHVARLRTAGSSCGRGTSSSSTASQVVVSSATSPTAATTGHLPPSLQKIVATFQMVPDPMARYKQLLFYATKLPALPSEDHVPANKVEGCVSQVWVKPDLRSDGLIYWGADSDSQLTKGLAALLVLGLSGCTPEEITQVDPSFIEKLGLKQSLTPSRNNGFLNMLRLMQKKSAALAMATASASAGGTPGGGEGRGEAQGEGLREPGSVVAQQDAHPEVSGSGQEEAPEKMMSMQESMRNKLTSALNPSRLVINDDSSKHSGHAGVHGREGGETHFTIEVISEAFEGLSLVKRHRMINELVKEEFSRGLHALALSTKCPSEV